MNNFPVSFTLTCLLILLWGEVRLAESDSRISVRSQTSERPLQLRTSVPWNVWLLAVPGVCWVSGI